MSKATPSLYAFFAALLTLIVVSSCASWEGFGELGAGLDRTIKVADLVGDLRYGLARLVATERGMVLNYALGNPDSPVPDQRSFTVRIAKVEAALARLQTALDAQTSGHYLPPLRQAVASWRSAHASMVALCSSGDIGPCRKVLNAEIISIEERTSALAEGLGQFTSDATRMQAARQIGAARILAVVVVALGTLLALTALRLIAQRKRSERLIGESESRFRTLADSAPIMIWTTGPDGLCDFVNRTWLEFTGRGAGQELGAGWIDGVYPADRPVVIEHFKNAAAAHKPFRVEYRLRVQLGAYRWVLVHGTPRLSGSGEFVGCIGSAVDITEHKELESALRASEDRFRMLANHAPVGIFQTDPMGRRSFVNEHWSKLTGLSPEEAAGEGWRRPVHEDDLARVEATLIEACRKEREFTMEYRLRHIDGAVASVIAKGIPLVGPTGEVAGLVGTVMDITARKQAEESLKALNETLEQWVGERTAVKDALLKEVHHRVKNNLQMISSLLSLQARQIQDEQARAAFEDSRRRVHSVAMVHEALYASHNLAQIDFGDYARNLILHLFAAHGVDRGRVALELDTANIRLPVDVAIPCALILGELASNSLKHTFAHGESGALRITFRRDGDLNVLETADTGTSAHSVGGAGPAPFGLRLVSLLAGQLDGSVEIHPEDGFRVTVSFPAAA